ncbi:MAG TPA: PqqD family protein [Vicinamibacterales bacterium]|nr:PqqD family protein [Vicinamibacterales bacterium]
MQPDRVLRVSDQVIFKPVGEEMVLLDFQSGMYYGLDPVGVRIWQLIVESRPLGEIVATLLEEYDVPREQLEADIDALVRELEQRGLVSSPRAPL